MHVLRRKAFYHNFSGFARLLKHPLDDLLDVLRPEHHIVDAGCFVVLVGDVFLLQEQRQCLRGFRGAARLFQRGTQVFHRLHQPQPQPFRLRRVLPGGQRAQPAAVRDAVGPGIVLQQDAFLLRQRAEAAAGDMSLMDPNFVEPPKQSIKMAVIVVATVPIMCVYPFLQKYFVKGVMVGALKG